MYLVELCELSPTLMFHSYPADCQDVETVTAADAGFYLALCTETFTCIKVLLCVCVICTIKVSWIVNKMAPRFCQHSLSKVHQSVN